MDSRQELRAYEAGQRTAKGYIRHKADTYLIECDDIIVMIECGPPTMSARTRALYDDALDARARALDPDEALDDVDRMSIAMRAFWDLADVEHALFPERPMRRRPIG